MTRLSITYVLLVLLSIRATASPIPDGKPHALTFGGPENSQFLLDGQPYQMVTGEMHPERIPPEYWRHRIRMAKAMGLNTVAIYIFWNAHEKEEGKYDFATGNLDTGRFLQIAREEGVWINLRPGPYCCGEWDFGGIPTYLLRYKDLKLRTLKDHHYTKAVENYLRELAKIIRPNLAENGGPILITQIENEYGSYPRRDHDYMVWLRDLWIKNGVKGPFYTADGAGEGYLKGIVIQGVAVGLNTGTNEGHWELARRLNPGVPALSSEVYPGWLRHWGEGNWQPSNPANLIKFYMENKKSFNLYMFHGGTNFGFTAGANNGGKGYEPDVTSYDYGSPCNENGRPTKNYHAMRKQLASYLPAGEKLPEIPAEIPSMSVPEIKVTRMCGFWQQPTGAIETKEPKCFEDIGQNQGMMYYRIKIPAGGARRLVLANMHDYALVFLSGKERFGEIFVGTLDRRLGQREITLPACDRAAWLEILVEGMGHINFTGGMETDRKGIYGEVKLGSSALTGWEMWPVPLTLAWLEQLNMGAPKSDGPGGIFEGSFSLHGTADTFLDMSKWKKGVVWVNGHNLGRYWSIGPQQRLYCPAPWLKRGENWIIVTDLILSEPQPIEGKPERN
jgi:beta-galactosidase